MLMMIISKNGEINKKTPISRNWTLLANKVEQKLKRLFIKGFYCRLLFTWSGTFVLCSPLLPPFTQLTVCQSHHHHHHGHFHCRWLCNLYLGGGILWQSRFLFVIHILSWSTKSVKATYTSSNTIQQRTVQHIWTERNTVEGGERANYLSFCLRKLVFSESAAEECQTITQVHSQCQKSQAKQHQKNRRKKSKFQFFLRTQLRPKLEEVMICIIWLRGR